MVLPQHLDALQLPGIEAEPGVDEFSSRAVIVYDVEVLVHADDARGHRVDDLPVRQAGDRPGLFLPVRLHSAEHLSRLVVDRVRPQVDDHVPVSELPFSLSLI
nr:hypothetical protein similar to zinc carboxypeptidase A metalloprotease (M14) [uncultured archaeon]